MAKLLKITGRIIGITFEWILILILFLAFAVHTSSFQTFITQKITNYLSKELDTEIKIDKISIVFINRLAIDGLLIKDQKNDTLAYISTLYVTLDEINPEHKLIINKVDLEKSTFHLSRDKKTGDYNYWFITDYFESSKKTKSKTLGVHLKEIHLTDVSLDYDDNRKYYSDFGMDYDHLKIRNIHLDINNMSVKDGVYKGFISKLSATEKSGFILNNLTGYATVSPEGIHIKRLGITTPLTSIYAHKLNMNMHSLQDVYTFEDSVSFDASLNYCKVSMKDISLFAPALEGMDQIVYLKANVTRKIGNLKIANLDLKTGHNTHLEGDIVLPDFNHFEQSFFNERIDYAYVSIKDLKQIKLPVNNKNRYIKFDEYVERLQYFETKNVSVDGHHDEFVFAAKKLNTALGSFELDNGISFEKNQAHNSYTFKQSLSDNYDVKVDSFKIGKFLNNNDLGIIDGIFSLSGEAYSLADIHFDTIGGDIDRFDYLGYSYKDIKIKNGKLVDNVFEATSIDVHDPNLVLSYHGKIDFKGKQSMDFEIDIEHAVLENLNITHAENSNLSAKLSVKMDGDQLNNISGRINLLDNLKYSEGNKKIDVPKLTIDIKRLPSTDYLEINSALGYIKIDGKVDFKTIIPELENQVSKLFPAIIPPKYRKPQKGVQKKDNHFNYFVEVKDVDSALNLFIPNLKVAKGTIIKGSYNGVTEDAVMHITSSSVQYQEIKFSGINLEQKITSNNIIAKYYFENFHLNDSIDVDKLSFDVKGTQDNLYSTLEWNPKTPDESFIQWNTSVLGIDKYDITLLPSFFNLKQKKWNVLKESVINIDGSTFEINHFVLEREKQFLSLDGKISKSNEEQLNFRLNDFRLDDFSSLFGSKYSIKGLVNGWGFLSNPYTNLTYIGDANIQDLYINNREIGNVFIQTQWDKNNNSFGMTGDLIYKGVETFAFDGRYYSDRINDNLDFNLIFDNTDIQFVNAFMDPDLLSNIKGLLIGSLKLNGTIDNPKLDGNIHLEGGNAKLALLNVNFGLSGTISADEDGFYINNMPVTDEEGNTGSLVGSIYHTQFEDWNFDLAFNLEDNGKRSGFAPGFIQPLDKFLVMNTTYDPAYVYYGKGYATGMVNVSGYLDNIEINVDLTTEKGSEINFPMYGVSEINGETTFIHHASKSDTIHKIKDPKIDFTGVDMKLNFHVTPDAKLKIILNDQTDEEIVATGSGDITVALNNLNDLTLDGTFTIDQGKYHFIMRPTINEIFILEQNGTITWTGDPYDAILDLKCYYIVNANLNELAPSQNMGTTQQGNQPIKCYIILTESILKPAISFDIVPTKLNETSKTLLDGIRKSPDMLNKQFFSLLLAKKFQRIDGQSNIGGGSDAAYDLLTSQINQMLNQMSKEYKLNVDIDKDNITGGTNATFGFQKEFLDGGLVLTSNVGIGNQGTSQTQSSFIGDVNLEYILNEAGTFKISIFNESNQNSILQNKLGLFTQGAGIQYEEDFNSIENFKLYQYFLDIFRHKDEKKYPVKRKRKHKPLPELESTTGFIYRKTYPFDVFNFDFVTG